MVWYLIFIQKPLPQGQWVLPTCPLTSYRKHSDGSTSHTCSSIKITFVHLFPSPGFVFLSVWYLVLVVCLLPRVASGLWFPYCFIFSLLRAWNPGLCLGSQHWLTVKAAYWWSILLCVPALCYTLPLGHLNHFVWVPDTKAYLYYDLWMMRILDIVFTLKVPTLLFSPPNSLIPTTSCSLHSKRV